MAGIFDLKFWIQRAAVLGLLVLGTLVSQCKPNQNLNKPKDPKTADAEKSPDTNVDEKIDIPSNIAGSYLTCAVRKEAKANDLDAQYGCLLTDKETQKKLSLESSARRLTWSSSISDGVKVVEQEPSGIYHVLYNLSGPSVEAIAQLAKSLEVIANWQLDSGRSVPVKQDFIGNVLKPAVELEDFEAPIVREQAIQTDRPGSL